MSDHHLHIVAFDVPFPPDYGGVIDIFYKIKALHAAGVNIYLHCFDYGRGQKDELKKYCKKVFYYKRNTRKTLLFHKLPFIAVSRRSAALVNRLAKDDHPILFEGLHSCYHLDHPKLSNRVKLVRTHNIEHEYYMALARVESNGFKKAYFSRETLKLRAYEDILRHATAILAISPSDEQHFTRHYGNAHYLPAFHSEGDGNFVEAKDRIAFYHGNLAVGENDKAALWLTNEVFSKSEFHLVIAGNGPSVELRRAVFERPNVSLMENLDTAGIRKMVQKAWINILPTFQNTGIKLKLLFSLYNGGYCLVNTTMVEHTGLEEFCVIKDDPEDMANTMEALMRLPFGREEFNARITKLNAVFSTEKGAHQIIRLLESFGK